MKNCLKIIFITIGFLLVFSFSEAFDAVYPVEELGNCASREDCRVFCDNPENHIACITFSEKQGMISDGEAKRLKDLKEFEKAMEAFEDSPGGCVTPRECDAYCRILENLEECLNYSVKYGYMAQKEAEEIREESQRTGPGSCTTEQECRNYCEDPDHSEECLKFAVEDEKLTQEEADFMRENMQHKRKSGPGSPEEEGIDIDKVKDILSKEKGPGGCSTMEECADYCSSMEHAEECLSFAVEKQLAEGEDLERLRRVSSIKSGPGGCQNNEECDAYCSQDINREECFRFTKENKLASEEEIMIMEREMEIGRKLDGGVGPGGCKTPQECNTYCSQQSHLEECIDFSIKSGSLDKSIVDEMMGQTQEGKDELRRMEEEKKMMQETHSPERNAPPSGYQDRDYNYQEEDRSQEFNEYNFEAEKQELRGEEQREYFEPNNQDMMREEHYDGIKEDYRPDDRNIEPRRDYENQYRYENKQFGPEMAPTQDQEFFNPEIDHQYQEPIGVKDVSFIGFIVEILSVFVEPFER